MTLPRYPAYKDSGVEWLEEIPEHWDVVRLKHILDELGSGGTPDTSRDSNWANASGTPWVAIGDMSDRDYVAETQKALTTEGIEEKRLTVWPVGTLLFSMYASLGHVAELRIAASINQAILALLPKKEVDQSFLKRWFQFLRPRLKEVSSSNTQDNLNAEKVRNLIVLKPPKAEQRGIATFLDHETSKIDTLIAEQKNLIALLKEKRQAVISHAVTKGLNPDAPMKDSGVEWLGEVPGHWHVARIGSVFFQAQATGREDLPVLTVSIHHGVSDREFDDDDMDRKVSRIEDRSKYKTVEPGDLVYNMMRAWQGGFGAVQVDGLVSPAYVVARPKRNLRTDFVEKILRTPMAVEEMRRHSVGVTDFRLRLYWEDFKNIRIGLPPVQEQDLILSDIGVHVDRFDALMSEAKNTIEILQERRSALISAAVTGKIDVRGLVSQEAA